MPTEKPSALDDDQIDDLLDELDDWELTDDGKGIEKTFRFADFNEAFGFMTQVALFAERIDHHTRAAGTHGAKRNAGSKEDPVRRTPELRTGYIRDEGLHDGDSRTLPDTHREVGNEGKLTGKQARRRD